MCNPFEPVNCAQETDYVSSRIWASLQLVRISEFDTESKISAQLHQPVLLNSLDDTYKQLFNAILDREKSGWIHDMLAWIVFGLTPLSARTICYAIAIRRREMGLNPFPVPPDIACFDQLVHGFVRLDGGLDALLVTHHTASGFLKQQPEFDTANDMIAHRCLIVLGGDNDIRFHSPKIYHYATWYWQEHVRAWNYIDGSRQALLHGFLSNKAAYRRQMVFFRQRLDRQTLKSLATANLLADIIGEITVPITPEKQVIWAICFSLPVVLRYFLQQMPTVRSPRWLALAVVLGHLPICSILIQAGVGVDTIESGEEDEGCRSSMHIAARAGHKELMKLLLQYGADVDRVESNGYTALQVANNAGDMGVVSLLHDHGDSAMTGIQKLEPVVGRASSADTANESPQIRHHTDDSSTVDTSPTSPRPKDWSGERS